MRDAAEPLQRITLIFYEPSVPPAVREFAPNTGAQPNPPIPPGKTAVTVYFLLTCYPKDGDWPLSSTDVTAVGPEAWGELLGTAPEQLVDVYPLTQRHADRVQQLTDIALDLEKYDYFLEPEADSSP
jgi:hypothetical protein